jgi:hypothetical protein
MTDTPVIAPTLQGSNHPALLLTPGVNSCLLSRC